MEDEIKNAKQEIKSLRTDLGDVLPMIGFFCSPFLKKAAFLSALDWLKNRDLGRERICRNLTSTILTVLQTTPTGFRNIYERAEKSMSQSENNCFFILEKCIGFRIEELMNNNFEKSRILIQLQAVFERFNLVPQRFLMKYCDRQLGEIVDNRRILTNEIIPYIFKDWKTFKYFKIATVVLDDVMNELDNCCDEDESDNILMLEYNQRVYRINHYGLDVAESRLDRIVTLGSSERADLKLIIPCSVLNTILYYKNMRFYIKDRSLKYSSSYLLPPNHGVEVFTGFSFLLNDVAVTIQCGDSVVFSYEDGNRIKYEKVIESSIIGNTYLEVNLSSDDSPPRLVWLLKANGSLYIFSKEIWCRYSNYPLKDTQLNDIPLFPENLCLYPLDSEVAPVLELMVRISNNYLFFKRS